MKREPNVVYHSIAETHLSNILISVVDDNPSVCEATQRLLRSLGFTVEAFSSAAEFLRSPRLEDTSCLILDVHMPGITGFQLQSLLIAGGHSIPTIFISSTGDDVRRTLAMRAGAVEFLPKPFNDEALLQAIRLALNSSERREGA